MYLHSNVILQLIYDPNTAVNVHVLHTIISHAYSMYVASLQAHTAWE